MKSSGENIKYSALKMMAMDNCYSQLYERIEDEKLQIAVLRNRGHRLIFSH